MSLANGPGRPKKEEVAARRRKVGALLVISALGSRDAIERIAAKMSIGKAAIKSDLQALRLDFEEEKPEEPDLVSPLVLELAAEARAADTLPKLELVGRRVSEAMLAGTIDRSMGPMLTSQLKEQRQLLLAIEIQRRVIDSRLPVVVEVVYVNDWEAKVAANVAAERDEE